MIELQKSHLAAMRTYVSTDKLTQFDEFVSKVGTDNFPGM